MVRLDTPPDAVDKVYAKALFELAFEQGGRERLEALVAELDELVDLVRQIPEFEEFMASRIIAFPKKEASLRRMFEGKVSPEVMHLALLLQKKGRSGRFVRVAVAFDQLVQERFGRVEVDVYTRFPMPPDQMERLRDTLRAALGREPVVYTYTDSSMIGGLRVRVGDRLVDASFSTRLRKMRDLLKEDGAALIKARFEQAVEDNEFGTDPR
jgi:F-type H+-transporting ATPase subunit delta